MNRFEMETTMSCLGYRKNSENNAITPIYGMFAITPKKSPDIKDHNIMSLFNSFIINLSYHLNWKISNLKTIYFLL